MRMRAQIRACFSCGVFPLLMLGLCAFFVTPHSKSVHARVPTSRSIRAATRSSESYLIVDRHEGEGAQSAASLGPSIGHKDHPPIAGDAPAVLIAATGLHWTFAAPGLLPRGNLDIDPSNPSISIRTPRGPPSI